LISCTIEAFGSSNEVFVPTQALQNYILNTSLPAHNPAAIPFYQQIFGLYNNAPGVANAQDVAKSLMSAYTIAP